jgi:hypothetical protein
MPHRTSVYRKHISFLGTKRLDFLQGHDNNNNEFSFHGKSNLDIIEYYSTALSYQLNRKPIWWSCVCATERKAIAFRKLNHNRSPQPDDPFLSTRRFLKNLRCGHTCYRILLDIHLLHRFEIVYLNEIHSLYV